jgi:hypothetical protein
VLGQVQHDVAASMAGQPGWDVDQVAAQGGAAGAGVEDRGESAGGAEQVAPRRATPAKDRLSWHQTAS